MDNLNGVAAIAKGNNHHAVVKNPLRDDAFDHDDHIKIELIAKKFAEIMDILGLDLSNDSVRETPVRVARMYINEVFKGINPKNKPGITVFKNEYNYHHPLVELNIPFTSFCEHHFLPIQGVANVAYLPKEYVIGLSKIHRLVDFYARRPQVQERLTMQIAQELLITLRTEDVGVVLKATHGCISCRGVEDLGSSTITSVFRGLFEKNHTITSWLLGLSGA